MKRPGNGHVPREVRVAAVADYLLGEKIDVIEIDHNVSRQSLMDWIDKTGHFKHRVSGRPKARRLFTA